MKPTRILSIVSIAILSSMLLDAYLIPGTVHKKTYERRYSEPLKSRSGSADRNEFILTTDGSNYAIPYGTFIPLESGVEFTVVKTQLFNRLKAVNVGTTNEPYTIYLSFLHIDPFAKIMLGISLFSTILGLVGRLLKIKPEKRFAASFFGLITAIGLFIFYLW